MSAIASFPGSIHSLASFFFAHAKRSWGLEPGNKAMSATVQYLYGYYPWLCGVCYKQYVYAAPVYVDTMCIAGCLWPPPEAGAEQAEESCHGPCSPEAQPHPPGRRRLGPESLPWAAAAEEACPPAGSAVQSATEGQWEVCKRNIILCNMDWHAVFIPRPTYIHISVWVCAVISSRVRIVTLLLAILSIGMQWIQFSCDYSLVLKWYQRQRTAAIFFISQPVWERSWWLYL